MVNNNSIESLVDLCVFCKKYEPLVVHYVSMYCFYQQEFDDMYQSVMEYIIKAYKKYDPNKSALDTYITSNIMFALGKYIRKKKKLDGREHRTEKLSGNKFGSTIYIDDLATTQQLAYEEEFYEKMIIKDTLDKMKESCPKEFKFLVKYLLFGSREIAEHKNKTQQSVTNMVRRYKRMLVKASGVKSLGEIL